jgi:hypothetical protein
MVGGYRGHFASHCFRRDPYVTVVVFGRNAGGSISWNHLKRNSFYWNSVREGSSQMFEVQLTLS